MFLHEAEVVEATQQQPTAVHTKIEVHLLTAITIEVVLNVLRQVHVEHDKVVEVTPAERLTGRLASEAAAPLACTGHGIQGYLW